MFETVEVLVDTDDINKIYYTEDKSFAANKREEINLAWAEYRNLVLEAQIKGYRIIKREKNVTPMDDGIMEVIDKKTNEFGGPSR